MELSSFVLLVALALGLALQPFAVLAAVLFATAKGGTVKAVAFVAGWMGALTTVGVAGVVLLPGREASKRASPAHAGVDLVLGVLLAAVLIWRWRRGPVATAAVPGWVGRIDTMSPIVALGLGAFLPSYLLVAAAVNQPLEAGWTGGALAITVAGFVLVASSGVALPLAVTVARPDQAPTILNRWREWLLANRRLVAFLMTGLFAALLMAKGVMGLLLA